MFNEFQVRMRGRRKFLVWGNVLLSLILIRAFTWLTKKVFHRLRTIQAEKVLLFFQPFQLLSPGFRQIELKLNFEASPASSRAIFDLIVLDEVSYFSTASENFPENFLPKKLFTEPLQSWSSFKALSEALPSYTAMKEAIRIS